MSGSSVEMNNQRAASEACLQSRSLLEGLGVLVLVLIIPIALYLGNLAPYGRVFYPVSNVLLAAYLFARRSPWYVGHCLLLFCFVSLIRRLIDEQAGWDPSNPVLLTPYLCCMFTIFGVLSYWSSSRPRYLSSLLAVLLCIAYGTLMAMLYGRMYAGLADALKWSVGPMFAVYMLSRASKQADTRRVVESCLVWAGALMSAYGIVQYIDPPSWDIQWVRNVAQLGLTSIGQPEPFSLRVFSTMNSPGSLAMVLSAGFVVGLKRSVPVTALAVTLMTVGLALAQYRAVWVATAIALVVVISSRRAALRPANVMALIAIALALCSTTVVPRIRDAIVQRASSMTTLKDDESLKTRLDQYVALARADDLVLGEGLAITGASRRLDNKLPVVIDSGLIEIWRAMGVVVGSVYLLSITVLVLSIFGSSASVDAHIVFDRAIVVAAFIQLPMGSVQIGELGFCAWVFLGFGLAAKIGVTAFQPRSWHLRNALPRAGRATRATLSTL
jgi:hypothetical protein